MSDDLASLLRDLYDPSNICHMAADALEAKDAEIARLGRDRDRIMQAFTDERELHMTTIAERDRLQAEVERLRRKVGEYKGALRERIALEPQRYAEMTAQFQAQAIAAGIVLAERDALSASNAALREALGRIDKLEYASDERKGLSWDMRMIARKALAGAQQGRE